ncbi:MAG: lipase family protein [Bacteroidota bacterium]
MPTPNTARIEQSFAKLNSGQPLAKQDFLNIAWQFAFHPDQDQALMHMLSLNDQLAQCLLIFQRRLNTAKADEAQLNLISSQLYYHYIVNTQGFIHDWEDDDPDDYNVLEAVTEYAQLLCVKVKEVKDIPILVFNDEEKPCSKWGRVEGWSLAWSLRNVGKVVNRVRYGRDDVIPSISFPFDPDKKHHTKGNAMTLADFAHLAYMEPVYIEKQLQAWGFSNFHWIEDTVETDTQSFVTQKDHFAIVCFRGTSSGTDGLIDARIFKTNAFGGTGRVHSGFKKALDSVWTKIDSTIDGLIGVEKIFVTGHSLGAALAQLCAYRIALKHPSLVAGVYVYGSPRVANRQFKAAYNQLLKDKTYLHINHKDAVPTVPPAFLGYQHLGLQPRTFDSGHQMLHFPQTEEDHEDQDFEDLDPAAQEKLKQQLLDVQASIKRTTAFLKIKPEEIRSINYTNSDTASGAVDDHSMARYLFKLACSIVDDEWERLKGKV